jgi:catechol 2,3-dioxygenase-like lactoylglutathione lyase family enzyme
MSLTSLNHVTIRTEDLEGTRDFYQDVLGLVDGFRPDLGFPGYWLYCGKYPVVHLVPPANGEGGGSSPDTGNFDHVAFSIGDFEAMRERLRQHGITFREQAIRDTTIRQIFLQDPNKITIELNFQ